MRRIAIIDLGTNSVRFDIYAVQDGNAQRIHREKIMLRLGESVFTSGKIAPESITRTQNAFAEFKASIEKFDVQKVIAVGTCALRDAANGPELIESIRTHLGIPLKTISGKEEARLIAKGIMANEQLPKGIFALIDIGGGSTEVSLCQGVEIIAQESFSIGALRLMQLFTTGRGKTLLPSHLRHHARVTLSETIVVENWPKPTKGMGSSGTVRSVAKLLKCRNGASSIHRKELNTLIEELVSLSPKQLLDVPGMEANRADLIIPGAIVLSEIMAALDLEEVSPTNYSLRDGLLAEYLAGL